MNKQVKPGDTVELKDKDTGFYDDETQFKIVRDQQVKLGKQIGARTNTALMSGGLLVVDLSKEKDAASGGKAKEGAKNEFPKDLPGRESFVKAGLTFEQVKGLNKEHLLAVEGIDAKIVDAMTEWADKNRPAAK